MNEFGIVGYGIVGQATHLGLLNNAKITYHDPLYRTNLTDLKNCNVVFFCIPTTDAKDIDNLINLVTKIKFLNPTATIVIRSTVPMGIGNIIQSLINDKIFYIPEFLRERCWQQDCLSASIIVGHDDNIIPDWLDQKQTHTCSLKEAEILKMFSNNYAALRVVFANHFYNLSTLAGADYDKILSMYFNIEHNQSYLEANNELRGFGGKCLPKDLEFIIDSFEQLSLPQTLFTSLKLDNLQWPTHIKKS